jgi:hypothetical protein
VSARSDLLLASLPTPQSLVSSSKLSDWHTSDKSYKDDSTDVSMPIVPLVRNNLYRCYQVYRTDVTKSIVPMLRSLWYRCYEVYCTDVTKSIAPMLEVYSTDVTVYCADVTQSIVPTLQSIVPTLHSLLYRRYSLLYRRYTNRAHSNPSVQTHSTRNTSTINNLITISITFRIESSHLYF